MNEKESEAIFSLCYLGGKFFTFVASGVIVYSTLIRSDTFIFWPYALLILGILCYGGTWNRFFNHHYTRLLEQKNIGFYLNFKNSIAFLCIGFLLIVGPYQFGLSTIFPGLVLLLTSVIFFILVLIIDLRKPTFEDEIKLWNIKWTYYIYTFRLFGLITLYSLYIPIIFFTTTVPMYDRVWLDIIFFYAGSHYVFPHMMVLWNQSKLFYKKAQIDYGQELNHLNISK